MFLSILLCSAKNERRKRRPLCLINAVLLRNMFLFILLCSEKNERGKRRCGYRAIRSDADASFGGCGTRSAQTVLAFFPPRLSPSLPDKCGFASQYVFVHSSQQREERTGKAPPRLSGFSLGRRRLVRGLRNSLCSNSPRLFPSSAVVLVAR